MRYFKIKTGFKDEDFISIDETELEAAMYAFMTDSKVICKNGMVHGRNIISITEDWHKEFGWNYGYKLLPEDFEEINTKATHYRGLIAQVKDNVQNIINTNQRELLGKTDYSEVRTLRERTRNTNDLHIVHRLPKPINP